MPWNEIECGKKDTELNEMKKLIRMRNNFHSCKSRNFHFPNDIPNDRVISYIKIGENESLQVYLNCEEEDIHIDIHNFSEIIYSRKWRNSDSLGGILSPNGILILKK